MEKQMFSKKATKKKVEAEETEDTVSEKELEALQLLMDSASREKADNRLIALFGDIDEPKAGQLCYNLHILSSDVSIVPEDPEDMTKGVVATVDPIQLMICSPGGNASEMFAIYDNMRLVREVCDIETFGVGKVMSAGVLLLAAGTKGKRTIGKNCRVMIHSVIGGVHGGFHNVENEMDEIRWVQSQYIKMLASETDMTQAQLKKMLQRKVNIYLSAEEAVEMGIADVVV
jgi:ATP-dependent Clp endopeptidase proteolytic subunit ClpP|tara:strand:- start:81 stop:770 length:690 start_codon:yes stop_codon:yes gene_type:complete